MWPATLSRRLPIVALVSRYLTNKLIGRGHLLRRTTGRILRPFQHTGDLLTSKKVPVPLHMVLAALSLKAGKPAAVIPLPRVAYPRVTHPFAALLSAEADFALDLHV